MSVTCRRAGARALLLEVAGDVSVRGWEAWLRAERDGGRLTVIDIVAGAQTILLDGLADPAATATLLAGAEPTEIDDVAVREITVRVTWDGPDLAEVATQWSISRDQVVADLTGCRFEVAFSGFAPGFAYLTGLPAGRTVSRRPSPRTTVPAGSVGLAGPYAAIYPRSSPGGWQLVGSSSADLFDPDRDPPALLGPGTVVRMVTAQQAR